MGRIPEYQRRPVVETPQDTQRSTSINNELRGQQAIASGVGAVAQAAVNFEVMDTRIKNNNYIKKQTIELKNHFDDYSLDLQKQWQEDPEKANESLEKEMTRWKAESLKGAPNGRAAEQFGQGAEATFSTYKINTRKWADKQFQDNTNLIAVEGLDDLAIDVYRDPTPARLAKAFKEMEFFTQDLDLTMDPQQKEAMEKAFKQSASVQLFEGLLDKNQVKTAEAYLKSKKFDNELEVDQISRIQKKINKMKKVRTAKAKDYSLLKFRNPHEYWKKTGAPLSPVNFGDPGSVANRTLEIASRTKSTGVDPAFVKFLSNPEEEMILKKFESVTPQEATDMMQVMGSYPDAEWKAVAQQLTVKNPGLGVAMGLVREKTPLDIERAQDIMKGMQLIKKNEFDKSSAVKLPKASDISYELDSLLSGLDLPANTVTALKHSTKAMYAKDRLAEGIKSTDFGDKDKKMLAKSLYSLVGKKFSWDNQTFPAVRDRDTGKYLEPDMAVYALKSISNDVLKKTHGSAAFDGSGEFEVANSVDRMQLYPIRSGKNAGMFNITIKKRGDLGNFWLNDKDGNKFVLDVDKLSKGVGSPSEHGIMKTIKDALKSIMPESMDFSSGSKQ